MRLLRLTLRNFKGIKGFTLDVNGADASVYAANGVGKTTLHDAWTWLLFGKGSNNRADFDIKTLDENNRPIHGLDHEVEAVLRLEDGREVALRKVYAEKWTKRRGSPTAEFTGHTTDHFIDGVPVKKADYETYIAELADENVFRLLSDPAYFNEHLHWQDRRKLLLEVCGDITDTDVIASNDALAKLPDILKGRTLDDHRKVIAARRAEINKQLATIPVRIDEVHKGLPELPGAGRADVEARLADLRRRRQEQEEERTLIQAGGAVAEYRKRLAEIEAELVDIKGRARSSVDEKIAQLAERRREFSNRKSELESKTISLRRNIEAFRASILSGEERMEEFRAEWARVNAEEFTETLPDVDDACVACGQPLPAEQVGKARAKAQEDLERRRAEFNERKARRLAEISELGKRLRSTADDEAALLKTSEAELAQVEAEARKLDGQLAAVAEQMAELQSQVPDVTVLPEYQRLAEEKANVEQTIQALQESTSAQLAGVESQIKDIDEQIASVEGALARFEAHERGLARIEELKDEERKLAAEFERLEQELFLTEEFTRAKVRLLEERINSRFKIARFKLFKELVNGGIEDTCETLLNGVPWPSINGAGKIQVGLDIINTLAEHYGFAPPVFIDDAVTITDIPETTGQQIRLIVSAADKTLRVETTARELMKEAS